MSHTPPIKSETKTVTLGSPMEIMPWVQPRGTGGGRNVIDYVILVVKGTITVATATWNGLDVCRLFSNITIEDRAGRARWSLSGLKTRIMSIFLNGIESHQEHADIGAGALAAVELRLLVPFTKNMIVRGKDFALPADLLGKITLNFNTLGGAASGTTVLSVPALTCYALAQCHEEHAVEFKCEDMVRSSDFNSNTQAKLSPNGALHDALVVKEGVAAGGDVITAITDARCEDLGTPTLLRLDLVDSYRRKRRLGASGVTTGAERFAEPVLNGFALPIIVADDETSSWDGKVLETVKFDVGTGAAGLSIISREVCEKQQANYNAQVGRYKVNPDTIRMKTAGKSRRPLTAGWTKRQVAVGCWSAHLPAA